LKGHGLISACHTHRCEKQGAETRPTYYFYRHQDQPFHIDYVFVPKGWRVKSVEVGPFREWGQLSDHVPVVVDVSIGSGGGDLCSKYPDLEGREQGIN
jgi:exodeoxyribonuclease III